MKHLIYSIAVFMIATTFAHAEDIALPASPTTSIITDAVGVITKPIRDKAESKRAKNSAAMAKHRKELEQRREKFNQQKEAFMPVFDAKVKAVEKTINKTKKSISKTKKALKNFSMRKASLYYRIDVVSDFVEDLRKIPPFNLQGYEKPLSELDKTKLQRQFLKFKSHLIDLVDVYYTKVRPVLMKNVLLKRSDRGVGSNINYLERSGIGDLQGNYENMTLKSSPSLHDISKSRETAILKRFNNIVSAIKSTPSCVASCHPISEILSLVENKTDYFGNYSYTFTGAIVDFPDLRNANFIQAALDMESEFSVFKDLHDEYMQDLLEKRLDKKTSGNKHLSNGDNVVFTDLKI